MSRAAAASSKALRSLGAAAAAIRRGVVDGERRGPTTGPTTGSRTDSISSIKGTTTLTTKKKIWEMILNVCG